MGETLGEISAAKPGERPGGKISRSNYMQEMEYVILASIRYRLETIRHILAFECVMTRGNVWGNGCKKR